MNSGMSSALGGAGGGGLLNTTQSTNANVATYASMSRLSHHFLDAPSILGRPIVLNHRLCSSLNRWRL